MPVERELESNTLMPAVHLVPSEESLRATIRKKAEEESFDRFTFPLSRNQLEESACRLLESLLLDAESVRQYQGFTMVSIANRYWRSAVMAVPPNRRLILLPHCMRDIANCPATYDPKGLDCRRCGRCPLDSLLGECEKVGCNALVAEGTPVVIQSILSGHADAILGVGCLKSLERSFDRLLRAGIPAMAIPLLEGNCRDSKTDLDVVLEMIRLPYLPTQEGQDAVPNNDRIGGIRLLRETATLFAPEHLTSVLGVVGDKPALDFADRVSGDFLSAGGKFYRPFLLLGAYEAMLAGNLVSPPAELSEKQAAPATGNRFPETVRRMAIAMEAFHKASLVHDDIEDGDWYRYGNLTIHRQYGTDQAINIGDHLLGMGYRLITTAPTEPQVIVDILGKLSLAHLQLCQGQGAELYWRKKLTEGDESPTSAEMLRIYSLKTAPAFEVALYIGVRLALSPGTSTEAGEKMKLLEEPIANIARTIGIAFQIRNDLNDWEEDGNKKRCGDDFFRNSPTILKILAESALTDTEVEKLRQHAQSTPAQSTDDSSRTTAFREAKQLYHQSGAFRKANLLKEKYALRSVQTAESFPPALRDFLIDIVESIL